MTSAPRYQVTITDETGRVRVVAEWAAAEARQMNAWVMRWTGAKKAPAIATILDRETGKTRVRSNVKDAA